MQAQNMMPKSEGPFPEMDPCPACDRALNIIDPRTNRAIGWDPDEGVCNTCSEILGIFSVETGKLLIRYSGDGNKVKVIKTGNLVMGKGIRDFLLQEAMKCKEWGTRTSYFFIKMTEAQIKTKYHVPARSPFPKKYGLA
jgi:hypothetical protein